MSDFDPSESTVSNLIGWNVAAGGALGLLVGMLLGLSSAPIVASVLAAVLAGVMIFLSLTNVAGSESSLATNKVQLARIMAFSLLALCGALGGLLLRAHSSLGPTDLQRQYQDLVAMDVPPEEARAAVLAQYATVGAEDANRDPVFFSSTTTQCRNLDPSRFESTQATLTAFMNAGGSWKDVAERFANASPEEQSAAFLALHVAECGNN